MGKVSVLIEPLLRYQKREIYILIKKHILENYAENRKNSLLNSVSSQLARFKKTSMKSEYRYTILERIMFSNIVKPIYLTKI